MEIVKVPSNVEREKVGIALFPAVASILNHSCDPNTAPVMVGNRLVRFQNIFGMRTMAEGICNYLSSSPSCSCCLDSSFEYLSRSSYLSIYFSSSLIISINLFFYQSIFPSTYFSINLFFYQPIFLSTYFSISLILSINLFFISLILSIKLFFYISINLCLDQ